MARTQYRWKNGQFKGGKLTKQVGVSEVFDFGTDLGPDRVILNVVAPVTSAFRFIWMCADNPDEELYVFSPEQNPYAKGIGHRVAQGGTDVILEVSEGKRYWYFYWIDNVVTASGQIAIEGGLAASPNQ